MYRLFCIKFILILFLGGCAGLYQDYEAFWAAKQHMDEAQTMENSQQLHEAMLEYVYVARNFPASSFYKTAIFRTAMLSGRLDNPKRNLSTSLYWLNQYLKLPLSEQEQENVQFLIILIKQNKQYRDRIAQLQTEFQNQRAVISQNDLEIAAFEEHGKKRNRQIRQLQKKIVFYEEQIKEQDKQIRQLQAEISKAQDALQQFKEIDVRIHQRRLK
jgi:hypothetical protein